VKWKWISTCAAVGLVASAALFWFWQGYIEHRHDDVIHAAASRYEMDFGLVKAVVWRESRFDAGVRGKAGELGLMQVGADAAREWADSERIGSFHHEHCLDPATNTLAGTWYLHKALSKYGSADEPLPYALAEYNAGRRNVFRWKTGAAETNSESFIQQIGFPTTSNYVRTIMAARKRFAKPERRRTPHPGSSS